MRTTARLRALVALALPLVAAACEDEPPPQSSYFDENISPVLNAGCVQQTTGCHLVDSFGTAAGNLAMSTFDELARRRDVLTPYGPYPVGLLLMKAGDPANLGVETLEGPAMITTDIRHNAGITVALGSSAFALLKRWMQDGAARTGAVTLDERPAVGGCRNGVGTNPRFDPSAPPDDPASYARFVEQVQPILSARCSAANCHGSTIADFYVTCGDDEAELRWNYFVSVAHLESPASTSELLRRPLAGPAGGAFHEGSDVFETTNDPDYQTLLSFAEDYVSRNAGSGFGEVEPGFAFFVNRVQPVLVRRGCMFLNCHSPSMFHDLRLRGGAGGSFSSIAMERNYEMSLAMLALESPDPNDSRLVAKNLYPAALGVPGAKGLLHRGGALLEEFGTGGGVLRSATVADCEGVDADAGDLNTTPGYCIIARWHAIEREAAIARGELTSEPVEGILWVSRPPDADTLQEFDTFRGGASLMLASATLGADGALSVSGGNSLNGGCGLGDGADVRNPAVSWDGSRIAFAARESASAPLRVYVANADGSGCAPHDTINVGDASSNGILVHNFDPAFAPDGRIVFASTRGNADGATRTPAGMLPNANLYVFEPEGNRVRQLTFLLNQELAPSFMADGRVIFTTEKRAPGFYQLAGRRQNLDGGDYHPLFGQRQSIGFNQLTEVVELPNRNLAFVASDRGAVSGAGAIGITNRSIGPDQSNRDPADRFYYSSFDMPAPGAFMGGSGAFRSPAPLPGGRVLVSCASGASSLSGAPISFDVCELDPTTGAVRTIAGDGGASDVEAVAIYGRPNRGVFVSRQDEANAHTRVVPGEQDAIVHVQDFPLLETLLFANTREGRPLDPAVGGVGVLESMPPQPGTDSFDDERAFVTSDDFGEVYVRRRRWGDYAPLAADGSVRMRIPGGVPFVLEVTNADGDVLPFTDGTFEGPRVQREEMQFYPGERANQSMRRTLFNGLCGGCHGSVTGRETDVAVNVDILTSASRSLSSDDLEDLLSAGPGDPFGP
ncbi:MAG: PD40 domain-containing protein [Deltaproteobacteria bacterium]|nr:PD40 domain-containing protein [Deltaproteobacteria bacterium]